MDKEELLDWYKVSLHRLTAVCKECSAKYTRSRLRNSLPKDFSYILEELLRILDSEWIGINGKGRHPSKTIRRKEGMN